MDQTSPLNENTITFGKYKDLTLSHLLRDRKYCSWLLKQEWFPHQYEYLYHKVFSHNPKSFFVRPREHKDILENVSAKNTSVESFLQNYEYFNLFPLEELKISLTEEEK